MIVSWKWLHEYLDLDVSADELASRLMMAGLNHESTTPVDDDLAIDLEVTSNRPDCLSHLGIAREAAVLLGKPLRVPAAALREGATPAGELTRVALECPELCPRYTARVIRGVRVGPSPEWMRRRLATVGIGSINNVVDITNYVLLECGQPLHAFDLGKLVERRIVVRRAAPGETFLAINHRRYELNPSMCVIADARRPVALGGVMGGAETEVTEATTDLLIESADFDPVSIRTTARALALHSDSSYRFERGIDPQGVDWASRRCCELILELAGGELARGAVDVGTPPPSPPPIVLRYDQLPRILGIDVPDQRVREILDALGLRQQAADARQVQVVPPSWRRDLTREIDLVEEVARIHGYQQIPEDRQVPMTASRRRDLDRLLDRVRGVLTACGFDEAVTSSVVTEGLSETFSPWSDEPPLRTHLSVLRGANRMRRSLVPSLLEARQVNEAAGNERPELFEIARVYLPRGGQLPEEPLMLGLVSSGDYLHIKGVIEALLAALHVAEEPAAQPWQDACLEPGAAAVLKLGDGVLAHLGQVAAGTLKGCGLRQPATVAEVRLDVLLPQAVLLPRYVRPPDVPAIDRDVNLVVAESLPWSQLAAVIRASAGAVLEQLVYRETYRDEALVEAGQKSILLSLVFRDPGTTLTSAQADAIRDRIVTACAEQLGARLKDA